MSTATAPTSTATRAGRTQWSGSSRSPAPTRRGTTGRGGPSPTAPREAPPAAATWTTPEPRRRRSTAPTAQAAGPKAVTRLADIFDAHLAAGHSPHKGKKPWKPANNLQIEDNLDRWLRGFEDLPALDVTRETCDRIRAQAGTDAMVRINTSVLRGFLVWGEQHGYFTPLQAELLPRACSMPAPTLRRTAELVAAPVAVAPVRINGQAAGYVNDEDAPSRHRIAALATELAKRFPRWGALAPELAASSGARWGEQFQLTAFDAHLDGCAEYSYAHLHVDWQVDAAGSASSGAVVGSVRRVTRSG